MARPPKGRVDLYVMSFKAELKSCGASDIVRNIPSSYICYTNVDTAWTISITDGISVWRTELLESDITKLKATMPEVVDGLRGGDLKVSPNNDQLLLTIPCQQQRVSVELSKLSDKENKEEIKTLLFRLTMSVDSLQDELKDSKKRLEDMKKASSQVYTDLSGVSSSSKATVKPVKPAGHSIINPSAKRRKAAGGVVFGEGEEND